MTNLETGTVLNTHGPGMPSLLADRQRCRVSFQRWSVWSPAE
jgi:hypothetical protein